MFLILQSVKLDASFGVVQIRYIAYAQVFLASFLLAQGRG